MNRRDLLKTGVAALAATSLPLPALAAYTDRPIKLVVPFPPGGTSDVAARLWAEKMRPKFGTIVVENKAGGGGTIGAAEVARAAPNGETLLFGNTSTQVIGPVLADKPLYDPAKDFVSVCMMGTSVGTIVIHESVPARTLKEFIDYAKANASKLSYGSAGAGTMTNLTGELFKDLIGAPGITHIPYKGATPAVTDLASGHIPMMTPAIWGPLLDFHRAGKVRILAVTAEKRMKMAPDIPTAIEAGLPGMVATTFNGLFAPAGVPKVIIDQLAAATREMMADAKVQDLMVKSGFEPVVDSTPEVAQKEVDSEAARWVPFVKKLKAQL